MTRAEGIRKMIKVSPGQQPGKEQVGPSVEAGGGRRQHPGCSVPVIQSQRDCAPCICNETGQQVGW